MKGLSGESSCGCFGVVAVNPWITVSFDTILTVLLAVFREPFKPNFGLSVRDRKKLAFVLIIWLLMAVPVLYVMLSLKRQAHATLGTEFVDTNGKRMIVLEPEKWVGKEFPLASRFVQPTDYKILEQGEWTVILIHADCPKCLQLLSDMERRADKNVAIIEVPSGATVASPKTQFPYFTLDENNAWFVTTPCIVKLSDWICILANEP
ncbi:hypothetical protein FACS1894170_12390 [Planctomycetales bacterium]|nr:hypothetical protein FACS1894170_12390 [Planctomycetales bacterium]